jgi:hypothetical protein
MIILAISSTRTMRSPGFSKQAFAHKEPFGGDPTFGPISIVAYPLDKSGDRCFILDTDL